MKQLERHTIFRILKDYGFAICLFWFALLMTLLLEGWIAPHTTSLFLAAIALTAWQKGLYPSLSVTLLSGLAIDYFFNAPVNSFEFSLDNVISSFVFIMAALIISWAHEERKRAIDARNRWLAKELQARSEAERANRSKDMFLAMVSHELRAPLNVILPWIQMLQRENLDSATRNHALAVIERNAKIQKQLIEDLLDVSQITAGKFHIETRPIELIPVIENAISTVTPALEVKRIELCRNYNGHEKLVQGDAERLQQVLWNLLSNAIKFTPENGRIEVRLETTDSYVQIIITDTGEGISEEFLPYVFDHFFQGDNAVKARLKGLGLGLAIVRHLIEAHGGTVQVTSAGEGLGSTFTIELPLNSNKMPFNSEPAKLPEMNLEKELSLR
jgi:signal transduction histidine kinase